MIFILRPTRAKNPPKIQDIVIFPKRKLLQGLLTGRKLCSLSGEFK